ncbi:hypothetical protein BD413DRAFT_807 [Trametes elegans]|nr:hypothetical protein BD413DRAFT_807 [Trametes elegans]
MIPPPPRALTQAEVDRLPVVLYIPSPSGNSPVSPISLPERAFTRPSPFQYPPSPAQRKTHRFVFWRPHRRPIHDGEEDASPVDVEQGGARAGADWERAAYRSVCLPAYRAQCSICLVDFEAPGQLDESAIRPSEGEGDVEMTPVSARETTKAQARDTGDMHSRVEMPLSTDRSVSQGADTEPREALRLLRMLGCGHVYHKECIDRWLTVEAQRYCPYCRCMVEIPAEHAVRSWPRWRRGTV